MRIFRLIVLTSIAPLVLEISLRREQKPHVTSEQVMPLFRKSRNRRKSRLIKTRYPVSRSQSCFRTKSCTRKDLKCAMQIQKLSSAFQHRNALHRVAASTSASDNFAGLIDIGAGRKMYLECSGSGSPTVILESGYRNDADIWSAELEPGMSPVFSQVAKFTRVCAYDRPGTFLDADHLGRSTRRPHAAHRTRPRFRSSCLAPDGARPGTVRLRCAFLWRHLCPVIRQHLPERGCWNGSG